MRKTIILLITLLFFVKDGITQMNFTFGSELGMTFSPVPEGYSYAVKGLNNYVEETYSPLYSPLVGLSGQTIMKKYIKFTIGLQYQMIGQTYIYHSDDLQNLTTYTTEQSKKQRFHKLCIPLTTGFTFKLSKLQPSLFIGYRLNYFIYGYYYTKYISDNAINTGDISYEEKYNPVSQSESEFPVKKYSLYNNQIIFGLSLEYEKIKISIIYNKGTSIFFAKYKPPAGCVTGYFNEFINTDYMISIGYNFAKFQEVNK